MTTNHDHHLEIDRFLEAIYLSYHYDFRNYARASLCRRLEQARLSFGSRSLAELQATVLDDPAAFSKLLTHLTVQVTEMFRDPHCFRTIRESVIPYLKTFPSLKVWIAGCSTGEELYSLAIMFREEDLEKRTIFYATDINTEALRQAEAGVYRLGQIPLYSRNYRIAGGRSSLSDYYTEAYGAVVLDKTLRQQVVFSDHSLVTDSIFAEVQMISCRNVLIYLDKELQDRVVGRFVDSLTWNGFLSLGSRETLRFNGQADEFTEFDRASHIYQKRRRR